MSESLDSIVAEFVERMQYDDENGTHFTAEYLQKAPCSYTDAILASARAQAIVNPQTEPAAANTCIVCGRTQEQVEAAEPGPHFRMRHGKCEDCASGSDYRTCTLPNCTDHHEREVMARCEDCNCTVATGDGILVSPVLCWVCRANRSQPESILRIDTATQASGWRAFNQERIARDCEARAGKLLPPDDLAGLGWTFYSPLLALPAATGTPTERRATLERAFDSNAERLAYNYGAMRVDPACSSILEDLTTAIADQCYEDYESAWIAYQRAA